MFVKKTFKGKAGPCLLEKVPQYISWSKLSLSAFIIYIIYLAYLVFWSKYYGRNIAHHSFNLFPFNTIKQFLFSNFDSKVVITNIFGNIAAFLPMGFLLPVAFRKMDILVKVAMVTFTVSVVIEILQYITGAGTGDIDDIILNLTGGIIGFAIYRISILRRNKGTVRNH